MKIAITGLLLILAARPAHACMGAEILLIPLGAIGFGIFLLFLGKIFRDADQPIWDEKIDSAILSLALPLPLYAAAVSIASTGNPGGKWRCTFADSMWGQVAFHIGLPLALAVTAIFLYSRSRGKERPPLRVILLWAHVGLWGSALATVIASIMNRSASPEFWRSLHYGNIGLICTSVLVTPKVSERGNTIMGYTLTFLGYALVGIMAALFLRIF